MNRGDICDVIIIMCVFLWVTYPAFCRFAINTCLGKCAILLLVCYFTADNWVIGTVCGLIYVYYYMYLSYDNEGFTPQQLPKARALPFSFIEHKLQVEDVLLRISRDSNNFVGSIYTYIDGSQIRPYSVTGWTQFL